jgi:hypothetical protein
MKTTKSATNPTEPAMSDHTEQRAKSCIKQAKAQWGTAWEKLTPEMRQAFVALALVTTIVGQDEESASPDLQRIIRMCDLALSESL